MTAHGAAKADSTGRGGRERASLRRAMLGSEAKRDRPKRVDRRAIEIAGSHRDGRRDGAVA
jgi:hypothetical protein